MKYGSKCRIKYWLAICLLGFILSTLRINRLFISAAIIVVVELKQVLFYDTHNRKPGRNEPRLHLSMLEAEERVQQTLRPKWTAWP
jgi:hypothetical protein